MNNDEKYKKLNKENDRREDGVILEMQKQYKLAFVEIDKILKDLWAKYEKDGSLEYEEVIKFKRLQKMNENIAQIIKENYKNNRKIFVEELEDLYQENYLYTGFILETEAQVKLNFNLIPTDQVKASVQFPLSGISLNDRFDKNNENLQFKLKQNLTQHIIQGKTIKETSEMVQDILNIDFRQAVTFVRTENTRIRNAGHQLAYDRAKNYGLNFMKVWVATLDERTRESHQKLDGQVADDDGYFMLNGNKALYPGGFGVASLDVNCRCRIISKEYEEISGRRTNVDEKEVIPYMTYNQWKKYRVGGA